MENVKWLRREFIVAAHNAQIKDHGGSPGLRDEGLLESALARPVNLNSYEPQSSVARLAAAYLFGIARNHPFVDGNKRVAYAAAEVFLILNGRKPTVGQVEKYEMVMRVASGEATEEDAAMWFEQNSREAKSLPTFKSGGTRPEIDLADGKSIHDALDEEDADD